MARSKYLSERRKIIENNWISIFTNSGISRHFFIFLFSFFFSIPKRRQHLFQHLVDRYKYIKKTRWKSFWTARWFVTRDSWLVGFLSVVESKGLSALSPMETKLFVSAKHHPRGLVVSGRKKSNRGWPTEQVCLSSWLNHGNVLWYCWRREFQEFFERVCVYIYIYSWFNEVVKLFVVVWYTCTSDLKPIFME